MKVSNATERCIKACCTALEMGATMQCIPYYDTNITNQHTVHQKDHSVQWTRTNYSVIWMDSETYSVSVGYEIFIFL